MKLITYYNSSTSICQVYHQGSVGFFTSRGFGGFFLDSIHASAFAFIVLAASWSAIQPLTTSSDKLSYDINPDAPVPPSAVSYTHLTLPTKA